MKNALLYNFNLNIDTINEEPDGNYSFYIDYDKYYIIKFDKPEKDIEEIAKIIKNYPNKFHNIYYNRFSSLYFEHNNIKYLLMKLNSPEHIEIDINDILNNEIIYKDNNSSLNRTNWSTLWSEKVDYLEYQVSELGTNHPIIRESFSYYVGLAENAITYFNMLSPINADTYLTHRRIKYPTFSIDFYNPTDLVIDYRVRNISSYIKTNFFNDVDISLEIDNLIKKNVLTPLEYNLLFCRLLYPSYYFDKMHKVLEEDLNEELLLKYILKSDSYEDFLNDIYTKFSTKSSMIKIDWLTNRKKS